VARNRAEAWIDRLSRLLYRLRRIPDNPESQLTLGGKMASKADIVEHIANSVDGLTKKAAGEAFDAAIEAIEKALKKGDRVQVPGFGSFNVSKRAARKGRNPATGATITIKASKNVRFKAGKELKDALNKGR
jgi:DNA-binding protein HU-beta